LRNIKLTLRAEFICPCPGSIFINTNNIPNLSDLTVMECYLKSIEGAKNDKILVLCLSQSKLYLKITGILSQTSYGYISINSLIILTVSKTTESPQKELLINTSHILRQSILVKILSRLTSNHYITVY